MATILCIDDLPNGLAIRKLLLETEGYRVLTASDGITGIKLAREHDIKVVVLDYHMPEMNGERVAKVLKSEYPQLPVVLLSGETRLPARVFNRIDAYVHKGDGAEALLAAIEDVIGRRKPPTREQD